MKLLAFSDVHLDSKFGWANRHVARRQRQRLREGVTWAFEQARREDAAAVLIAGDLFEHDLVSPDTVEFLRRTFERSGIQVFAAPGNHDPASKESPYRRVDWPGNVHIFLETHFVSKALTDGVTIWGAAHRKPADTPGFFEDGFRIPDSQTNDSGIHIALFHGEERNAAVQGTHRHAPFDAEQVAAAGFDHAAVGHSHKAADDSTWTRLGSLEQLTFGGAWGSAAVLETGGNDVTVRRLKRPPALHRVDVDVTGAELIDEVRAQVHRGIEAVRGAVRVRLHGVLQADVRIHATDFEPPAFALPSGTDQVLPDHTAVRRPFDLDEIAREPTVRGAFVKQLQTAEMEPEVRRLVLLAGLRALEGETDPRIIDDLRLSRAPDEAATGGSRGVSSPADETPPRDAPPQGTTSR